MSEKQRNEPPVKLTRAEKREIQAIIRKYKGDGKAHSAQASIPYQAMYPDGICRVTANTFSKCIEFADISYQLAQADTKTAIFENLCDLYNYLDASIHVQLSFVNRKTDPKQYAKSFEIRAQGDDFDDIRAGYSGILQDQLVRGNNGLTKRKFLTFTIEADNLKMAMGYSTPTPSRFNLNGNGWPRPASPPKILLPRPRSASAIPGCSGWAASMEP